jgi:hypothetical protein
MGCPVARWRSLFRIDRIALYGEAIGLQTKNTWLGAKVEGRSDRRSTGIAAASQTRTLDRFAVRTPAIQG